MKAKQIRRILNSKERAEYMNAAYVLGKIMKKITQVTKDAVEGRISQENYEKEMSTLNQRKLDAMEKEDAAWKAYQALKASFEKED